MAYNRRTNLQRAEELLNKVGAIKFTREECEEVFIMLGGVKQTFIDRFSDEDFNKELAALYKKFGKTLPKK